MMNGFNSKENYIINDIRNRLYEQNRNWLCVVCGQTGLGKSLASVKIAKMINPDFNSDFVAFTAKEFLDILNSNPPKGSVIVFDEAGISISSREWYTITNKILNYVFQTFRYMNIAVIFTVPDFKFIDKQSRTLFHSYVELVDIDYKKSRSIVKWMIMQNNPKTGKIYFKYPRVEGKKIKRIFIHKPDKKLIKEYDKKQKKYKNRLRKELSKELDEIEDMKNSPEKIDKAVAEIIKNPDKFLRKYNKREFIDKEIVMNTFKVSNVKAIRIKKLAEAELLHT